MEVEFPKPPSQATLKKYGFTEAEWLALLEKQGGHCAVCERRQPEVNYHLDHSHVRSWKTFLPEHRKLYVRGILCAFCNRRLVARGMTLPKAKNIVKYLESFEARKPANDNAFIVKKPKPKKRKPRARKPR